MHKILIAMMATILLTSAAVPAQAQSFGIFFGDEPSDFAPRRLLCMTNSQIRSAVADMGYDNIALNVPNEENIQVRATRDGTVYLLDFNFCTGQVEGRQRLRTGG